MSAAPDIASLVCDAEWLAHRYDERNDAIHFVHVPRADHGAVAFLTDEYLPQATDPTVFARADIIARAPAPAPVHFIFHSAFCCSTLLAHALDIDGVSMGLSEPVLLNDIIGWRHRGERDGQKLAIVLGQSLDLLARPFAPGESIVIKPSNVTNVLAPAILGMRPSARALLLHAPLDDYLGSIARKGLWSRVWVRDLLVKLMRENLIQLGLSGDDYLKLTDVQAAAIGWLAQHAYFHWLAGKFGPERIATLSSDRLTADPYATLGALARFYGLPLSDAAVRAIATGPIFTRHSKSGETFSAVERAATRDKALANHADEIAKVVEWAEVIAQQHNIPMSLPYALTS